MPQKKKTRDAFIRRFYTKFNPEAYDQENGTMPELVANDQKPEVLIIGCIDSRVAPGMIFRMKPGEALTHRHIANLIPAWDPAWEKPGANIPAVVATIMFAVQDKQVDHVFIKGHTMCGGVKGYVEGNASALVKAWMDNAKSILPKLDRQQKPDALLRQAECELARYNFHALMTYPVVKEAIAKRGLNVESWIHDIEHGKLMRLDPQKDHFVEILPDGTDGQLLVPKPGRSGGHGNTCSHS